ncbi:MAG TPA: alkaline phosphatase family protein [Candidatus Polarisedimenticolaceae bacterium]
MIGKRVFAAVVLLAVAACAPQGTTRPAPGTPSALAVLIVVDGFAWHRVEAWSDAFDSGLRRLLDEGRVHTECRYRHVPTETGPGHASLMTGVPPNEHGIVANEWFERASDGTLRRVYCGAPLEAGKGVGPWRLEADTLGDRLVRRDPRARVVTVAGKDRSAFLTAGRDRRHQPFWYDPAERTFVTAPYYDGIGSAREVVERFDAARAGERLEATYGRIWSRLPPPAVSPARPPDPAAKAAYDPYVGADFDFDLASAKRGYGYGFTRSPMLDRALADVAIALVEDDALGLGRRGATDLLVVSFSGQDYVAHAYGPDTEPAFDAVRRLDRDIGDLLDALVRRVGRERLVVGLSADHGFCPIPPSGARRFDVDVALVELNAALPEKVAAFDGSGVWYAAGADRAKIDAAIGAAAGAVWGSWIDELIPVASIAHRHDERAEAIRASDFPGRSPDAVAFPKPGFIPDWYEGRGSTHGSVQESDRHVPMILWGAGVQAERRSEATTPYRLAPEMAEALRIPW